MLHLLVYILLGFGSSIALVTSCSGNKHSVTEKSKAKTMRTKPAPARKKLSTPLTSPQTKQTPPGGAGKVATAQAISENEVRTQRTQAETVASVKSKKDTDAKMSKKSAKGGAKASAKGTDQATAGAQKENAPAQADAQNSAARKKKDGDDNSKKNVFEEEAAEKGVVMKPKNVAHLGEIIAITGPFGGKNKMEIDKIFAEQEQDFGKSNNGKAKAKIADKGFDVFDTPEEVTEEDNDEQKDGDDK